MCLGLDCSRKRAIPPAHQAESTPDGKSKSKLRLKLNAAQDRAACICCVEGGEDRRGGCAAGKVPLFTLKMGNRAVKHRANGETVCCFSTPAPASINPPHRKDNTEAQKKWIIFSSATNFLCSPGQILSSWWGLL